MISQISHDILIALCVVKAETDPGEASRSNRRWPAYDVRGKTLRNLPQNHRKGHPGLRQGRQRFLHLISDLHQWMLMVNPLSTASREGLGLPTRFVNSCSIADQIGNAAIGQGVTSGVAWVSAWVASAS